MLHAGVFDLSMSVLYYISKHNDLAVRGDALEQIR